MVAPESGVSVSWCCVLTGCECGLAWWLARGVSRQRPVNPYRVHCAECRHLMAAACNMQRNLRALRFFGHDSECVYSVCRVEYDELGRLGLPLLPARHVTDA